MSKHIFVQASLCISKPKIIFQIINSKVTNFDKLRILQFSIGFKPIGCGERKQDEKKSESS